MAYKLITTPETEEDIENAVHYYSSIRTNLARLFLTELKAVKKYIIRNPKKFNCATKTCA